MTDSAQPPPPRRHRRWWLLAAPLLALALVIGARTFVADVYTIESGSMLPTLRVGERVLVRYARPSALERFDLVVFRPTGGGSPMVKRLAALPGEAVLIVDGDLVIDGAKLGADARRPAPIPLFDQALHDPADYFHLKSSADGGTWTLVPGPGGGSMEVDATDVRAGSDAGLAFFHKDVRDGYLALDGSRVPGLAQVGDAVVTTRFSVAPGDAGGEALRVRWRLVEAGDTFEFALGGGVARLTRRPGLGGPSDELASTPFDLVARPAGELRFANIDDRLSVHLDGELLLEAAYDGNQAFLGVTASGDRTSAPRVAFGAEGGAVVFTEVRIGRDLHFTGAGQYAIDAPLQLGLDEVFLLGDNSTDSADGRYFGPVPLDRIVGEPEAVVGEWGAPRWLGRGRTATGDGTAKSSRKSTQDS